METRLLENIKQQYNLQISDLKQWKTMTCIWLPAATLIILMLIVKPTRSFAIELTVFAGFYTITFLLLRGTALMQQWKALSNAEKIIAIIVGLIVLILHGWYLGKNCFIPFWDNLNYWQKAVSVTNSLDASVKETMVWLYRSINSDDYNQLMALILALPARIFPKWSSFYFIIFPLYLLPSCFVVALFILSKLRNATQYLSIRLSFLIICLLLTPILMSTLLAGYADVVSFYLLAIISSVLLDEKLLDRKPCYLIFVGLMCSMTFLLRRWMIYGIIGISISSLLYHSLLFKIQKQRILKIGRCLFLVALGATVCVLPFVGFIKRSLFNNYSVSYSAWTRFNSIFPKVIDIVDRLGPLLVCIALLTFLIALFHNKKMRTYILDWKLCFSVFFGGAFAALLFWKTQDFGMQHFYIIAFELMLLIYYPICCIINLISERRRDIGSLFTIFVSIIALVGSLQFMSFFTPTSKNAAAAVKIIFGPAQLAPHISRDVNVKREFVNYLSRQTEGTQAVYFAAASSDLNASIPLGVVMPMQTKSPFPVMSADVDIRDGFNTGFFDAQYVVTSNPVSLHMNKQKEEVVITLNKLVQESGSVIGRYYQKIKSFVFDRGVKVAIYQRISNYSKEDVSKVKELFHNIYPNSPELFDNHFSTYLAKMG